MNDSKVKQIFSFVVVALASLLLFACGGSGTYSPSVSGVIAPVQVSISISPNSATTFPGGTVQFAAIVTGTANSAVTWSVVESGGGSISPSGLYTAPNVAPSTAPKEGGGLRPAKLSASSLSAKPFTNGVYTVMAVSQADPTKSASASVTISIPQVTVTPSSPTVVEGQTVQLSAFVSVVSNQAVTWGINSGSGTVSPSGLYTAPMTPGSVQVQATSQAYMSAFGLSNITVVPPAAVTVTVTPPTAQTSWIEGASIQFFATVGGTTDQGVTWSIVPGPGNAVFGTISSSGIFSPTSNSNYQATVTIKATSVVDPTKFGTAVVTIINNS